MDSQSTASTTNIHTIVKAQIVFLLSTLTEENFERNQSEIRFLSEQHGIDTYLHFIRRLIAHSQARLSSSAPSAAFDTTTTLTFRLLVQETQRLARDPFMADRFREGIDKGEGDLFRTFDLVRFVERIGLRALERLILVSSIVAASSRKELVVQANSIIRADFESAVLNLCHNNPLFDNNTDLSPNQVQRLMSNLLCDLESPVLDASQRTALITAAQAKYGNEVVAPMLQQILPKMSVQPGTSAVQLLIQLGHEITSDSNVVRAVLARYGITDAEPPTNVQLLEIMSSLSKLAAEGTQLCDVASLVRAFNSYPTVLNWADVIKSFDWPERHGVDTATLKLLIAILVNSPRDAEPHAVTGFWTSWNNSLYQLRLLDALLSLPADTFNFVQLPGRRIVTVDDVAVASPTIKSLAANVQSHTWNSLDLFEVLVRLADSESVEIRTCVREMLDKAIKISAELVHMGLLQVADPNWNEIRLEYSRKLLAMFLAGHPNHQLVFMRIWQIEPTYLTNAFRDFYQEDPLNITRILDVAQDLKILDALLEVRPFTFALDVASLASRREYLNLDKWLVDNVANHGNDFLHAIIQFLEEKMTSEKSIRMIDPSVDPRTMSLSPVTITIFLRMLRNHQSQMTDEDATYSNDVRNICLQVHPRLMSLIPGSDVEPGFNVTSYPLEIETEVDDIYKQMYDENTTIDAVIAMLQRYKESTNSRDHEVFACMLHFLFDEYKFFQSYYPARELAMTGYLFGSLIQHSLIDSIPLGIAIRFILDALKCPPDSNLFKFGLQALGRFEFRLQEWTPLCEALLGIQPLVEARPDLIANIQRHLATVGPSEGTPSSNGDAAVLAMVPAEQTSIFTSISADPFDEEIVSPPEELSDKILFIVNNLAPNNFDSKVAEMKQLFEDEYSRWFANYLVDQRISSEPNNHSLYLRLLDALDRKPVSKFILHETFLKSLALLNSEKTMASASERALLKNVGTWLGSITLARDRPIRHKNLSFKDLLLEGYDNGRLLVAIPFVCKVLEGCTTSTVFKYPNPWLRAVISLLAELYYYGDLKLNFKFEIELLCTALDINLSEVEPTSVVRNRPLSETLAGPALPEYMGGIDQLPMDGYANSDALGGNDSHVIGLGPTAASDRLMGAHIENILSTLALHVHVNAQLAPLNTNMQFKRITQLAVDRAVREIILPVVERSVTIAGISTRELVTKDFATEPNEEKLRKAGHLMAQKLAGSLALVTCKEPLKTNLALHIRNFLGDHGYEEVASQNQYVLLLVQDNLEVACAAIEKAAMERAVTDADEAFASSFEARRRHRELRTSGGFWDPSAQPANFSSTLPDPLRIKATGVQHNQLMVYEDFGVDSKRRMPTSRPSTAMSLSTPAYSTSPTPDMINAQHQQVMERFTDITRDLEAVVVQLPVDSLLVLPQNHDVHHLIRAVIFLAHEALDRQRTPLLLSQKIVQLLYKTPSQLGREVYVALLDQLCHEYEDVAKEAITWLMYAEDDRKLDVPVTVTLLRSGLINIVLQDQHLAKTVFGDPKSALQNYIANLIRACLSADPPVATQQQFMFSLEVLSALQQSGKSTADVNRLLDDLRGPNPRAAATPSEPSDELIIRQPSVKPQIEELRERFQQWVTIFQRSSPEKAFVPFISQLTKQGILKVEDMSSLFFRICAETSVAHYIKCVATPDGGYAYQPMDALSRLIALMIKYHGDASGVRNDQAKVHYLTKILSIVVLVLANMHEEQGADFPQKAFFRFFSSLVNDLHSIEHELGSAYFQLLIAVSDAFSSLQPMFFPGFAFSWLCLISHRLFMPKLLLSENREGWSAFHKLLLALFRFLSPFLKDANVPPAARDLYRGALRLLLVLIHDFSDFLSEYYFTLCDVIPPRCIQLRNLVLCAFPPSIMLPDPYLPGIMFDSIPEMGPIPPILSDFTSGLQSNDLRSLLDQQLLGRGNPSFLPSLKNRLFLTAPYDTSSATYNLSLINSLVMYIGVSTVAQAKARSGSSLFIASDPGVVILQYLATNLDIEGQHHLLSAAVLHLRYPNAHTHWFSCLLLYLWSEINDARFHEVMTKVLLERFIVHRPHPWGVLVTFIELVRNPKYDFWTKDFIHIAPEINLLLQSVRAGI